MCSSCALLERQSLLDVPRSVASLATTGTTSSMMRSTTYPESKASTRKSARSKSKEKPSSNPPASQRPPDPRVGTRSVNTLSEAQLERKRANDREAQRIIRKRTRENIENLERRVAELADQKEQLNKALQHNSQLEAQIAALQRQIAEMAVLLLQYRQSLGVHGYTDTAPVYGASSYVVPFIANSTFRTLTEYRPKCAERVRHLYRASIARIRGDNHGGITPVVQPLRPGNPYAWPRVASSRTKLVWCVINCIDELQ
jgi:hypothetical protein